LRLQESLLSDWHFLGILPLVTQKKELGQTNETGK